MEIIDKGDLLCRLILYIYRFYIHTYMWIYDFENRGKREDRAESYRSTLPP